MFNVQPTGVGKRERERERERERDKTRQDKFFISEGSE